VGSSSTAWRASRTLDEFLQRVHLEAIAISFAVTGAVGDGIGDAREVGRAAIEWSVWAWPLIWPCSGGSSRDPRAAVPMTNRIRELRTEQGLGRRATWPARAGRIAPDVNAIEDGKYDPSLPLAFKIAALFGAAIEDVFEPEDKKPIRRAALAAEGGKGMTSQTIDRSERTRAMWLGTLP
jgi:putative transcriptional regulator